MRSFSGTSISNRSHKKLWHLNPSSIIGVLYVIICHFQSFFTFQRKLKPRIEGPITSNPLAELERNIDMLIPAYKISSLALNFNLSFLFSPLKNKTCSSNFKRCLFPLHRPLF